jgi:hypothetical protein
MEMLVNGKIRNRKTIHNLYLIDQVKHFHTHEMLKEWNGSLVHISEYDPKHPQIRRKLITSSDAIALQNTKISKISTTY